MTAARRNIYFPMFLFLAGPALLWAKQAVADGPQLDAKSAADATAAGKEHAGAGQIEKALHEAESSRTISLYGIVFGPENRPVAGARLYLNVDEWTDPIELGTSDEDGSYDFEVSEKKLRRIVAPSFMVLKKKASLIAVAEGLGPGWVELPSVTGARMGEMHHQYGRDFHLVADLPITGQVVDVEGKPVAGAVVAVSRIYDLSDPDWYKMRPAIKSNNPDLMSRKEIDPTGWFTPLYRTAWKVIPPARTDAEGRFRIAGVGRDRAINLRVEGPGIRNTEVSVLTRNDVARFTRAVHAKYPRTPDLDGYFYPPRKNESKGERGVPLFGSSPTIQVDPARTISGVVRSTAGEPITGVQVYVQAVVSPARATTDRLGRYRIQRSEDKSSILVYTRSDPERYLDVVHRLTDTQGLGGEIGNNIDLPRGVTVSGRVLEAGTDRPIISAPDGSCHVQWPGPLQTGYIEYFPLASNTALRGSPTGLYFEGIQAGKANYSTSVEIDPDGRFRIAVPPGPGVLLVQSKPGMPFNAELGGRWKEDQGFHRLFPYPVLESRTRGDGAPGEDLHSFPGFTGPIRLTGPRRYHAYHVINPPADAQSLELTITVPRGETRTIRFVKPDGRPIRRVKVHGLVAPPQKLTIEVDDSDAEVFALEPGKPRQITAMSDDGKFGGRTFVSTDDPQLRTITLEPTASISGRLLDASSGAPLAGYSVSAIYSDPGPWLGPDAVELAGLTLDVWAIFSTPADTHSTLQAAPNVPPKKPNLLLWIPEEELGVWDPVNPNVNPVPWRVFELKRDNGERSADFRHTAIGMQVRVEGIAWGHEVKTELPKSRVIFQGGTVLVNGVDFNKPEVRGKSVRVVGSLRLETIPYPKFHRQMPNYYFIDAKSFEIIDQIVDPNVALD